MANGDGKVDSHTIHTVTTEAKDRLADEHPHDDSAPRLSDELCEAELVDRS